MQREPYSALHVLAVVTAPIWFPIMVALYLTLGALAMLFGGATCIFGGLIITIGSLLELVGAKRTGYKCRDFGTRAIEYAVETIKEVSP